MSQASDQGSHCLKICIHGAKGLMKQDIFGLSDPYVVVYQEVFEGDQDIADIETTNIIGKTDVQKKTLNPAWNETIETEVDQDKEMIVFDVFDENRITRDDFLGRVSIPLISLGNEDICEKSFELGKKCDDSNISGNLILSFLFVSKLEREISRQKGWLIDMVHKYRLENQIQILNNKEFVDIMEINLEFNEETADDFSFDNETKTLKSVNFLTKVQLGKRLLKFLFETSDISEDDTSKLTAWFHKVLEENLDLVPGILSKLGLSDPQVLIPENLHIKCFKTEQQKFPKYFERIRTLVLPRFKSKRRLRRFLYEWAETNKEHVNEEKDKTWEQGHDNNGRPIFINHKNKSVHYKEKEEEEDDKDEGNENETVAFQLRRNISLIDPTLWEGDDDDLIGSGQLNINEEVKDIVVKKDLGKLPEGWEEKLLEDDTILYIDHINEITTREDPRFLDPEIAGTKTRFSQDYKYKYEMFVRAINRLSTSDRLFDILDIRREKVFVDSFKLIGSLEKHEVSRLRDKLWVEFNGEKGNDFGGLSREWFDLLSSKMFNPYYGLFEYSAVDNYTLQINPDSRHSNKDHLLYFRFIGRIVGMGVFHQRLINGFFIRPFYSMMLGKKIKLADMEYVDAEYHNSLVWIRDNDPECLELTFEVDNTVLGKCVSIELIPGGKDIRVTEENKLDYIETIINMRFVMGVEDQMSSFLQGFQDVVPLSYIKLFDEVDLELLISGVGSIDLKDWKENTEYSGYIPTDNVIIWFWRLLLSWGDEMRSRLLQFATGTSRVPFNGFAELHGSVGHRKFMIAKSGDTDSLPRAHTCFNKLDLPEYSDFAQLEWAVTTAVLGSVGYGGVD